MGLQTGYSHDDAYDTGYLKVSEIHTIHYTQYGRQDGKPVIFLHGGPGSSRGCIKANTVFFDPTIYRVVAFDQRGTGHSTPFGELRENTTQTLISDIEALRKHVGVEKWHMVFGGSWGSTLSLAYVQAYPKITGSLVIRGVSLGTEAEIKRNSIRFDMLFPESFDRYQSHLPASEQEDIGAAYHKLIVSEDPEVSRKAMFEFNRLAWAMDAIQKGGRDEDVDEDKEIDPGTWAFSRICTHYMIHGSFLGPTELLDGCEKIKHIPTRIAQGRLDFVCAPWAAYQVSKRLQNCELHWLHKSGHAATEPDTLDKLVEFCDELGKKDFSLS